MLSLNTWQAVFVGVLLITLSLLLVVWWRQQTHRWGVVLVLCLACAGFLSWWSGVAFQVPDYRAGCDGLCPGYRGAPIATFLGEAAGSTFLPAMFLLNTMLYLTLLLAWGAILRAILFRVEYSRRARRRDLAGQSWSHLLLGLALVGIPLALAPLYLPPPEARVRGDPQRVAINARREVYMYDQLASVPILRVGLEDVRPRRDGQPGMRVCLRFYSFFYLPTGYMYLDMAPEGVHSTSGGVIPLQGSCWQ